MKVRKFQSADAPVVSKLMIAAFKAFLGDKMNAWDRKWLSPKILKAVSHSKSFDGKVISFVVEENGKVLGYIRGSANVCGLGTLDVVGVDPACFHKGVGAALMKALEKFWRQNKLRKVYTCVAAHNKRAFIYYVKNGFVPEGYQRDHFKKGVDEIMLGRFLKD